MRMFGFNVGFLLFTVNALTFGFPFPEECGITYIEPSNIENATRSYDDKIVGGFAAVPGSWPWQAYLKYRVKYCFAILKNSSLFIELKHYHNIYKI